MAILIGVGSNISPEENILKALDLLLQECRILKSSTFYLTKAIGKTHENHFYNGVWSAETDLDAETFKMQVLRKVEKLCGRVRSTDKFAKREIDLDLLLYNSVIMNKKQLILPDPDIYKRNFIAYPIQEIEPNLIMPNTKMNINGIVQRMRNDGMRPLIQFSNRIRKRLEK